MYFAFTFLFSLLLFLSYWFSIFSFPVAVPPTLNTLRTLLLQNVETYLQNYKALCPSDREVFKVYSFRNSVAIMATLQFAQYVFRTSAYHSQHRIMQKTSCFQITSTCHLHLSLRLVIGKYPLHLIQHHEMIHNTHDSRSTHI